jgi:hypothetical protein
MHNLGRVLAAVSLTGWHGAWNGGSAATAFGAALTWMVLVVAGICNAIFHASPSASTQDMHMKVCKLSDVVIVVPVVTSVCSPEIVRAIRFCGHYYRQVVRGAITLSKTILLLPVISNAASIYSCQPAIGAASSWYCQGPVRAVITIAVSIIMIAYTVALLVGTSGR